MALQYRDIHIRTTLQSGDIGYITWQHATLYNQEYGYGLLFEAYVAKGLADFYTNYNATKDAVWICEKEGIIIGSLMLMHRENNQAQLRYFLLHPLYRGMGLGDHRMQLFITCLKERGFAGAYLLTTNELPAAATLYQRYGFRLTEENESPILSKPVKEQRYDLFL